MTDEEIEEWRENMLRHLRWAMNVVIVGLAAMIYMLIRMGEWVSSPMVASSLFVCVGSRYLLSRKAQTWLRQLRDS